MYISRSQTYHLMAATMPPKIMKSRRKSNLMWIEKRPLLSMIYSIRARAKRSGKEFDLTLEWLKQRSNICELSGLKMRIGYFDKHPLSASVDRVDSSLGYTQDNCRVVCLALNMAFNDWGSEAFIPIAKAFVSRLAKAVDMAQQSEYSPHTDD